MKRTLLLFLTILITSLAFAQQGINYKAAIRDTNGNLLINETIVIQFTIQRGLQFENVYQEVFNPTTDANGLINIIIGDGTVVLGDFRAIDWGSDTHFLRVQLGGLQGVIGFVDLGTTEFTAVPYAYHANNGGGLVPLDEGNGQGWRLMGRDPNNYGDIGENAVDFSVGVFGSSGAIGNYSTAYGDRTTAGAYGSFVIGRKNTGNGSPTQWVSTDPIFEIGIGGDDAFSLPNNALTVLKNGNTGIGIDEPIHRLSVLKGNSGEVVRFESTALNQTQDLLDLRVDSDTPDNAQFIEMQRGANIVARVSTDGSARFSSMTVQNGNTIVAEVEDDGAAKFKSIEFEDGTVQTSAANNNNNNSPVLAYGNISASGLVNSSSGNIVVSFNSTGGAQEGYYNISISGGSFSNTDTLIVFFNQRFFEVEIDDTNGDIQLTFTVVDNNGIEIPFVQTPFQFVLYN